MQTKIGKYIIKNELGRGAFGITYLAIDPQTNKNYVLKAVLPDEFTALEIKALIDLTAKTCNKYLTCYYESFDASLSGTTYKIIVTEYIEGQSLDKIFVSNPEIFHSPTILWPIFCQLILGLKYIHDNGYSHHDIKPANIILTSDYTIKYIDFGLSCKRQCTKGGTLPFQPPELFSNDFDQDDIDHNKAFDIWSLGITFYNLADDYRFPFDYGNNDKQLINNIVNGRYYESTYYRFDDGRTDKFLNKILIRNPSNRPNIDQVFKIYINDIASVAF